VYLDNGYSYMLDFLIVHHQFVPRPAFLPIAAAQTFASLFYQSFPLFPLYSISFSSATLVTIFGMHAMVSVQMQC